MAIYIPKPEAIEVYQWHKNGDMLGDGVINNINSGAIVGRHGTYGHFTGGQLCPRCDQPIGKHGVLKTPILRRPVKPSADGKPNPITEAVDELVRVVCPGNWVRVFRDEKKRITGYSVMTSRDLHERYVDLATIPQPPPEKKK